MLLLYLLGATVSSAQELAGQWKGTLKMGPAGLTIIYNIQKGEEGYIATADSPMQNAKGMKVSVAVDGEEITLTILPPTDAKWTGKMVNDTILEGTFLQRGHFYPLKLTRFAGYNRPQEPKPPFPYEAEEMSFPDEKWDITLKGTFTYPKGGGKFPAVILVTGSGTQNRDEEIMGHKPFLVLADYLTRNGIAVLRYDDRGYGEKSREKRKALSASTTEDIMGDALCAYKYLLTRSEVDPKRIGIIGHSEGGTIAFMAAAREPGIAFMVSMAGGLVKGEEILIKQNYEIRLKSGTPENTVKDYTDVLRKCYDIVLNNPKEEVLKDINIIADTLFTGTQKELPIGMRNNAVAVIKQAASVPWMRYYIAYDPLEDIKKASSRPFFAFNGTKDLQVDADMNLDALARLVKQDKRHVIRKYEGFNHMFQTAKTGMVSEYESIEETIAPVVLKDITEWIKGTMGKPSK